MITFSAKDLLTKSCRQIKMLNVHPELKTGPSSMMVYGSKFQDAVADTLSNIIGQEMRGTYVSNNYGHNIAINFSNDIVCNSKDHNFTIYEVKSVVGNAPEWYKQSSLLQCAFYKTMILMGADRLETASFYVNEGHERNIVCINPHINRVKYILLFGEEKYEVDVWDAAHIIGFFEYKAACCCGGWDLATKWDEHYKHAEFECLKNFFSYRNIF
jgi:hypothetical protein